MKKTMLGVLLIIVMLFVLTGCQQNKVVGTWRNNLASSYTLVLQEDKTFVLTDRVSYSANQYSGEYTVSGNKISMKANYYEYISYDYKTEEPTVKDSKRESKSFEATYQSDKDNPTINMDGLSLRKID